MIPPRALKKTLDLLRFYSKCKRLSFSNLCSLFSYMWFNHQSNCNTFHNYINLFLAGELLRARYSPIFPLKIEDHTTGLKDPSIFWIAVWVLLRPLSIDEKGWKIQGQLLNVTARWRNHLNSNKIKWQPFTLSGFMQRNATIFRDFSRTSQGPH